VDIGKELRLFGRYQFLLGKLQDCQEYDDHVQTRALSPEQFLKRSGRQDAQPGYDFFQFAFEGKFGNADYTLRLQYGRVFQKGFERGSQIG